MRKLTVRLAILWTLVLSCAAFARVHFRSLTTGVAYDLGQLKNTESRLLEDRSNLKGELARLTTKKKLEELTQSARKTTSEGAVIR
jgi:hypothetical protein